MDTEKLIQSLAASGIVMRVADNRLAITGRRDRLTKENLDLIRTRTPEIIRQINAGAMVPQVRKTRVSETCVTVTGEKQPDSGYGNWTDAELTELFLERVAIQHHDEELSHTDAENEVHWWLSGEIGGLRASRIVCATRSGAGSTLGSPEN
jgi:hypothetical protein